MASLRVPCSYQGGKQRVSKEIVDAFYSKGQIDGTTRFYDLCCGSGAITIELLNRGISPNMITMLDKGPWGAFWKSIGTSEFDINRFASFIATVPEDKSKVKEFMTILSKKPIGDDEPYIYPILQACSFGGKQIWREGDAWQNAFFRDYWLPTSTSVRRSPANPMQPGPHELLRRVTEIAARCKGLNCLTIDVTLFDEEVPCNSVVYIDPPYRGTTGYAYDFDAVAFIRETRKRTDAPLFLSEGQPLTENAIQLAFGGAKGGISGTKKNKHQEWLNVY